MGNEGIENDRLVFDYLSRVGDLAQQRQVPAAERRELVTGLRDEIERRRAVKGERVPGILRALGEPDALVGRVAPAANPDTGAGRDRGAGAGQDPGAGRDRGAGRDSGAGSASRLAKATGPVPEPVELPRPRGSEAPSASRRGDGAGAAPSAPSTPSVPAPREEGAPGVPGGWWRENATFADPDGDWDRETGGVPGFVGGVEIADLLRPPRTEDPEETEGDEDSEENDAESGAQAAGEYAAGEGAEEGARVRRGWTGFGPGSLVLLAAAGLLLVGAAFGSLIPLAAGWVLAYLSRERKGAALVVPGMVVGGGFVWLWGRAMGHWGEPLTQGAAGARDAGLSTALGDSWPWILRMAAVASALFLLWRARRRAA
ncbi:hypothetical protein ABZ990_07090 [Streptomyces sp. NPDC046203]|uniref:hypothetical protein n=1 Tax=Streptomyces sp. NPDC046203 TaxID=3154602 RepID=UPI0033D17D4B